MIVQGVAAWLPMVVEECHRWMNAQTAPCLKAAAGPGSNLVAAQELLYPDYKIRRPGFLNDGYATKWERLLNFPLDADWRQRTKGWLRRDGQTGQASKFQLCLTLPRCCDALHTHCPVALPRPRCQDVTISVGLQ